MHTPLNHTTRRTATLCLALCAALLTLLTAACEKEIHVDYRDVAPRVVAEGSVTQDSILLRLSRTQSVTDNSHTDNVITKVKPVISVPAWSWHDTLRPTNISGLYALKHKAVAGETYRMDFWVDGEHYYASSVMQQEPQVSSFRFVWKQMFSERLLFADLHLQDLVDQNNYYFMHIYRNNIGYRWAVLSDEMGRNGDLQQLFQCCTKTQMDNGDSDALRDGDAIRVEVRSIDRASYDYYYSMQVMDNSGTNPVQNWTGGCLGLFSAYHVVTLRTKFYREDVEEED